MFYVISKIFGFLASPFIWVLLLGLWAILTKMERRKKILVKLVVIFTLLFSNRFIVEQLIKQWEIAPRHVSELKDNYDYAIVLGGTAGWNPEFERLKFHGASDRIWQAVDLYKKGKVKQIILSGGSNSLLHPEDMEMKFVKIYLRDVIGIPEQDLLADTTSRTTRENAHNVNTMFGDPSKKYLLVTSAFHMRRALACFRQEGLPVTAYSVDSHAPVKGRFDFSSLIVPSPDAFSGWGSLMHEWVGYGVYDLMGYY